MHDLLERLFQQVSLPTQRIIFLHARLRRLQVSTGLSYSALSQALLKHFQAFDPLSIVVPSYTIYHFMDAKNFNLQQTVSGVGRFSEELRQPTVYRSPDPMYSVLEYGNYLSQQTQLNYRAAFGPNTLFQHLLDMDEIIVNIDLGGAWCTHFHQAEIDAGVDYRQFYECAGTLYLPEKPPQDITYQAYLRRRDAQGNSYPEYSRVHNQARLLDAGVWQRASVDDIEITWGSAQDTVACVTDWLRADPHALVEL